MLTAVLGIVAAFIFGTADFLGGLASQRISPLKATAVAAAVGLVGLLIALPLVGGRWSVPAVLWGGLSGVSGAIAISLLYACLAIGPMSILSPLTALVSAAVPMAWGLAAGEQLSPVGYVALGVALIAVVLVGFVPDKSAVRPSLKGIAMALGSGLMIGVFMILMDATPSDSGLVPLVMNRAVNAAVMFLTIGALALWGIRKHRSAEDLPVESAGHHPAGGATLPHGLPDTTGQLALGSVGGRGPGGAAGAATTKGLGEAAGRATTKGSGKPAGANTTKGSGDAASRVAATSVGSVVPAAAGTSPRGAWLPGLKFAIACGLIDALANAIMLGGMRLGDLSVISVLTALYPAGTIILAAAILRERIAVVQWVGLALAISAAAMLSL